MAVDNKCWQRRFTQGEWRSSAYIIWPALNARALRKCACDNNHTRGNNWCCAQAQHRYMALRLAIWLH